MRFVVLLSAAWAAFGLESVLRADSPQVVDLGYAIYQGTFNSTSNITDFFAVRYAAPPVGKLRFQAPAPPLNMRAQGVQLANTQPQACPMAGPGLNSTTPFRDLSNNKDRRQNTEIEDCLFLNVHVSGEINPKARMPVVVWIHGGGYVAGSTSGQNGSDLIREASGGIVAVELQYRLGVILGFLPGSEVKKNGALNAGLFDQQFALQWIQKSIHLFGGDASRVTIWGDSAGAGSVLQHIVAHGGNTQPPLFHQAITSSTFLPSQYNFDDAIPESDLSIRCSNASDTFQCLVDADAGTLESANAVINESGFYGTFVVVPVVGGDMIVERPIQTINRGRLNGVRYPLSAITNAFEGTVFVNANFSAQMTATDYVTQLFPLFNQAQIEETVQQYTNIGLNTVNDQAIAIMGECKLGV
ncbi:alpha/beta-hydrolase [Fomitiporia mediterranea MF3/22]|uniref:Carboxylic ester hydrolase n=1 Tax=Fomitiporia mediterranea (strain MF3/22) TaxID=694068 RepID=R7SF89_FOMME|nr:alpha/beta-hydrolase [Fomitiporia mediterranea MF3/22]EJC97368.1 alpha/beta-hydrolase [Fomitiporia mediterranea MF3/22]